MAGLSFDWDDRKDAVNRRTHGVTFAEAQTVFFDERALLMADPEHFSNEERFVLLGLSSALRALVVCHCYRQEAVIRIVSARKANRAERDQYEQRWKNR